MHTPSHLRTTLGGIVLLAVASPGAAGEAPHLAVTQRIPDAAAVGAGMPPQPLAEGPPKPAETLGFSLGVKYSCGMPTTRRRVFVTVADTVRELDVTKAPSPMALRMDVPWAQLAWLDARAACQDRTKRPPQATDADGARYFLLRDQAIGFVTLSCTAKGGATTMANATTPLDVWLRCPAPAADPPAAETKAEPGAEPGAEPAAPSTEPPEPAPSPDDSDAGVSPPAAGSDAETTP